MCTCDFGQQEYSIGAPEFLLHLRQVSISSLEVLILTLFPFTLPLKDVSSLLLLVRRSR